MEEAALSYFSSMNNLSKKIIVECQEIQAKSINNQQSLSVEIQDVLDGHFINDEITKKYSSETRNTEISQSCFPVMKIASGEKIVVDFEHDENGWTWTDEHSGPFSWRTKSQQDLTLVDFELEKDVQVKKSNPPKMSSFKEHLEIENNGTKNEVEEMFKKFGLRKSKDENTINNLSPENLEDNEIKPSVVVNSSLGSLENDKSKLIYEQDSKSKCLSKIYKKKNSSVRKKESKNTSLSDKKDLGNFNEVFLNSTEHIEQSLEDFLSKPMDPLNNLNSLNDAKPSLVKTGLDFLDNW